MRNDQSKFFDENNSIVSYKDIDKKKELDIYTFLPSDSIVLDFTSNYGIISCSTNKLLKNPKDHVVVCVQHIDALIKNRDNNNCQFQICNEKLSLSQLEDMYSLKFDVIISDTIEDKNLENVKIIFIEHESNLSGFYKMRNIYFNTNLLPFDIISYHSPNNNIGLFGKLGHISDITDVITNGSELCTVSLHAPSHLMIETKQELNVKGYASPTAKECPNLFFKVNEELIGQVNGAGGKTDGIRILPGKHVLDVHPSCVSWAHSVWLFEDPKNLMDSKLKYFKIDICKTGRGLVNQFINLINGIHLSNGVERYIYNPRFLPNYYSTDWIPLSEVFDIPHLNQMFSDLGFYVRIITDETIGQKEWIKPEYYNNVCNDKCMANILNKLSKEKYTYLDLGDVFSVSIEKNKNIEKIELDLYSNMRFTSGFHEALDYIKSNFLGDKYNVVHLRLEDDFIAPYSGHFGHTYEEYSMILLNRYLEMMENMFLPDSKIYIATHLLKKEYPNNYIIDLIRDKYPNIVTTTPWRDQINLPQGREIDAIIDYLIATNAQNFVGMHGSTFSILISRVNITKGNNADLVNLHP
jgi:hypothetical protein